MGERLLLNYGAGEMSKSNAATSCVFTTLRWDGGTRVSMLSAHLRRMRAHARRLGIEWPNSATELAHSALHHAVEDAPEKSGDVGLMTLSLNRSGEMTAQGRWTTTPPNRPLVAISVDMPRWDNQITGTKHGDWGAYNSASKTAREKGADVAVLVDNQAIVDGDRWTPLLLIDDGTAWYPAAKRGAIDSICLAAIIPALKFAGIPVNAGRLTTQMLVSAHALVAIGTGIGCALISEIDDQQVGQQNESFLTLCSNLLEEAFNQDWTDLAEVVK